jgi:hypothetical protein
VINLIRPIRCQSFVAHEQLLAEKKGSANNLFGCEVNSPGHVLMEDPYDLYTITP